jgi:hypothetical protein
MLTEILKDVKNNYISCLMCIVAVVYEDVLPVCVIGPVRHRRVNASRTACFTPDVEGHPVLEMTELLQAMQ